MEKEHYILFENYLSNKLTNEELLNFELRLKTDLDFNELFNIYKNMSSFLENKYKDEENLKAFKENLKHVSNSHFNKEENKIVKQEKPKRLSLYKYAIAASVVLLFGFFLFNQFSNPEYSDYSQYGTVSLTVRGSNSTLLKTAEEAFNNKDFTKADKVLENLINQDKNNSELKLYRAISNIELNNFKTSDVLLNDLRNGDSVYKYTAAWYLALSKLKQNNKDACIEILKTIPEDSDNYNQVKKLLNKLD